jgi:hypothetical protein
MKRSQRLIGVLFVCITLILNILRVSLKAVQKLPPSTHADFKNYLDPQWQFAVAVKEFTPHHFIVTKESSVNIPDE